jgi:signal transduction histidine kinase
MEEYYAKEQKKEMQATAIMIANNISKSNYLLNYKNFSLTNSFNADIIAKSNEERIRILIFDDKGIIINDSMRRLNGYMYLVPEVLEAFQKDGAVNSYNDSKGYMDVYSAAAITDDKGDKIGVVLLVRSVEDIYITLKQIGNTLLYFTVITGCILIITAIFMSQLLIDPLKKILVSVKKMSDGQLNERITTKGRDEFSELAGAFNDMSEKLEQIENTRSEFVSNVSHELKTPLSSMKVLSESILLQENIEISMYKDFLQDINSEIDRMTFIINDLLNLVRLEQDEMGLNIKTIYLNKMIEDLLKRLTPISAQKNIELIYENMAKVMIEADGVKLSLALSNLVENAIKYSRAYDTVTISLDADYQNAIVAVKDTGVGISAEEQTKIFNRFYRIDKTRDRETGGTGLGLAITQKTVLLHNGSIKVVSKEGEGSEFIVRLPLHQSL